MDNQREFLGIWVPKEIWLAKDLTIFEKVIYSEICSLDGENGCSKNNEYFMEFTGASQWTVSCAMTNLKNKGLIRQVYFDGRNRVLKAVKPEIKGFNNNETSENHYTDKRETKGRLVKITIQTSENHKAENNGEDLKSLDNIKGFSDLPKTESQDFFGKNTKIKERKEENKKEEKEKNKKEKTEKEKGIKEKVKKEIIKKEKEEINKEEKQESDNSFSPLLAKGGIDKGGAEKTPKTYAATLNELPALLEKEPIELRETLIEFVKMRKAIKKPLTVYALKLALAKMHSLGADDITTMKAIVEQSIENSWQGLFALRVDKNKNPRGEFNRNIGAVEKRERILKLLEEKENK